MYRRGSANVNDLINRFEITNEPTINDIKYVKMMRSQGRVYNNDQFGNGMMDMPGEIEISRSLIKFKDPSTQYQRTPNIVDPMLQSSPITNAKKLTQQKVATLLQRIGGFLEMLSRFPLPRMSTISVGLISLFAVFISPRNFTDRFLYPGFRLIFCIIYPAYASYKAIRTKNVREYVKWMMFWVVFAFLTCLEVFSDVFMSWFPFYFELKVIVLIWLLGGKGSSSIYKNILHPALIKRERDIDEFIYIAQEQGYTAALRMSSKGVHSITNVIMSNDDFGQDLSRNYSMSDISEADTMQSHDEYEERLRLKNFSAGKYHSGSNYMNYSYEDISSGYSSPDASIRSIPPMFPEPRNRSRIPKDDELGMGSEFYYQNNLKISEKVPEKFQKVKKIQEVPTEKTVDQLTEEEILLAYEKLQKQKREAEELEKRKKVENEKVVSVPDDMKENYEKFLMWMENQNQVELLKENQKLTENSDESKIVVIPSKEEVPSIKKMETPKVNHQEAENVIRNETADNEKVEHENSVIEVESNEIAETVDDSLISDFDEFKDTISISSDESFEDTVVENVKVVIYQPPEMLKPTEEISKENDSKNDENLTPIVPNLDVLISSPDAEKILPSEPPTEPCNEKIDENSNKENLPSILEKSSVAELSTKITNQEQEVQSSFVEIEPLKITENLNGQNPEASEIGEPPCDIEKEPLNNLEQEQNIIKSIKGSLENIEKIMIEAKLTLSDTPLEVKSSVTNLSVSSLSLSSDRSRERSTDSTRRRPASHSKGRAPIPPPLTVATNSTTSGQYYDTNSKKFFKETEI